jgi:hypothetical protein
MITRNLSPNPTIRKFQDNPIIRKYQEIQLCNKKEKERRTLLLENY